MTTIRPTRRLAIGFACGVPLAAGLGLLAPGAWTLGLVYLGALVLAFGLDSLLGLRRRDFEIETAIPKALEVGEEDRLSARLVRKRGGAAAPWAAQLDVGGTLLSPPSLSGIWHPGEDLAIDLALRAVRRGQAKIAALWLRWQGPFGLCERQDLWPLERDLAVTVSLRALRSRTLNLSLRDAIIGQKAQKIGGDGAEFDSLREFVTGGDRRRIDWKHSARHMKLLIKEFRAERNHQVILAFDSGHLMREPMTESPGGALEAAIPKLDHAIGAGLLLAYTALKSGDRVGLFAFDSEPRQYAPPQGGIGTLRRLQELAGRIEYRTEETNFTLGLASLLQRLERRSCIVLLSDFVDTVTAELMIENIAPLTRRHLVIFVALADLGLARIAAHPARSFAEAARAIVAHDIGRDRQIVLERLRRMGVSVIEAPPEAIGADLVNRYLEIKREDRL